MLSNTSDARLPPVTDLKTIYGIDIRLVLSALFVLVSLATLRSRNTAPYPPGPKRLPLLGNIHNFPRKRFVDAFTRWKELYGDLIYGTVLGTPVIIINSFKVAEELLVKKSSSYSFRPRSVFIHEMFGYIWMTTIAQPGPTHSAMRRIFKETLGIQPVVKYDPFIQQQSQRLIAEFNGFVGAPLDTLLRLVGEIVVTLAYGPTVFEAHGKGLIELNRDVMSEGTHLASKLWLVDYFPLLKHIPAWVPGATFKKIAVAAYKKQLKIRYWPWEEVNNLYKTGTSGSCIAAEYIEKGQDQNVARDALGSVYIAGTETTSSSVLNFFYAMMIHPEIQKKVQAEIDDIIGHSRLPNASDRPRLPYADAAWKENSRWIAPVPLSLAHLNREEDVYNGMRIPKNSKIFPNVSAMLRDPEIFDEPERYQPERWLESHNPKAKSLPDVHAIYGFGLRICPGRYLAERVGFTFAMSVLAAYDIVPVQGTKAPNPAETVYEESIFRRPANFQCAFKRRSSFADAF
ncbi:cytochrome P450 [Serendipita vermifera]|nr:cytochrome P450 [Serendipita vermifera]